MTRHRRADGTPMSDLGSECAEMMRMNGRLQSGRLPERSECSDGRCEVPKRKPFKVDWSMTPEQVANAAMKEIIKRGAASCIAENKNNPCYAWLFNCAKTHLEELVFHGELLPDDSIIEAAGDVLDES